MPTLFLVFATLCNIQVPSTNWQHQAVIYAEVVNAKQVSNAGWTIRLKPLAVLTGNFDAAATEEIDAGVWIGSILVSEIREAPKAGAKVIVVVQYDAATPSHSYLIPNGSASFAPEIDRKDTTPPSKNRPCLFEVTGFDDPKVTATIENVRKLRGKQREEAEKAAAEKRPAAAASSPANNPSASPSQSTPPAKK